MITPDATVWTPPPISRGKASKTFVVWRVVSMLGRRKWTVPFRDIAWNQWKVDFQQKEPSILRE
jgi:hypothetical protein